MSRILLFLSPALCALNLYGGLAQPAGCGPNGPSAMLTVDTITYSNFTFSGTANGCTISGTFGTIATTGYVVTITAFTEADPVIDFGMNFAGSPFDPKVSLMISTPYMGGAFSTPYTLGGFANIATTSFGALMDSDGNGSASVTPQFGNDIQTVKVNGSPFYTDGPQNPGCSFFERPAGYSQNCPAPTSQQLAGNFPGTGTLELDLAYTLSAGDSYNVSGSAGFTPEPATGVLLAAGLAALLGLARRRRMFHSQ